MRTRSRRLSALFVSAVAAGGTIVATSAATVSAEPWVPFKVGYNTQVNGGVVFAQNTSLTCRSRRPGGTTDAAGCEAAKAGTGKLRENNDWIMTHVDIDSDASTFNSSSSTLRLPSGARVKHASLYWGARLRGADSQPNVTISYDRVKLAVPGGSGYVDVVAKATDVFTATSGQSTSLPYQAKADVTTLVAAAGAGSYTVANLPAALGSDRYAGWTLAVVFEDPSKPLRDITLFDGFLAVKSGSSVNIDRLTVSGFRAPVAGAVDATIGMVAYDGDRDSTGDYANFNGSRLSSAVSPGSNYFNSTMEVFGSNVTGINPAYNNTLGYDVKVADATGLIANSATSATIDVATYGEAVYVGLISTRIDLTAPKFPSIKSVANLNGNNPALPGDTLRYEMVFNNVGDDPADNFVVSDAVPTGTTYVAGSLEIDNRKVTDNAADDTGEYDDSAKRIVARLGRGASATAGGRIDINATATVTFDVKVTEAARGTSVANVADLAYRAVTLQDDITAVTNTVTTPVAAPAAPIPSGTDDDKPELEIELDVPERVPGGGEIEKDIVIDNPSDDPAKDVVVDIDLDDDSSYVSGDPECRATGDKVRCTIAEIPAHGQEIITIVVKLDDDATAESKSGVKVSVSSSNTTAIVVNDDETTAVSANADLQLRQQLVGTASPGAKGTYRFRVKNFGPSTATKVVVTDLLPKGVVLLPTSGCRADTDEPRLVTCKVKNLKDGQATSFDMNVRFGDTMSGRLVSRGTVDYAGLDRRPSNNTSSVTVGLLPATR
jgi:uncharacterized repeat protein (TIGR01451 family)